MLPIADPAVPPRRRHDLDWLRVIAFGLLIFYHVGMFYVTWGWHIKSPHAGPALEPLMLLINPWRLALLFFISGVAVRFASDKLSAGSFLRSRLWRLGLPVAFGMLVVVAPQSYFELREAGVIEPGFWAFYGDYLSLEQRFEIITPTWNHLWYVVYLLLYSLLIIGLRPLLLGRERALERSFSRLLTSGAGWSLLLVPALPFVLYRYTLQPIFPTTHALVDDWANHAQRFTIFLIGFLLAKQPAFWSQVDRRRREAWAIAIAIGAMLTAIRLTPGWLEWVVAQPVALNTARVANIVYAWLAIVSLLALAQRYLNRPGPRLRYLTEAVYPYYIVHQTLIIAAGYPLARMELPVGLEVVGVVGVTVAGCLLIHAGVRRIRPLRPLFGLRDRPLAPAGRAAPSAAASHPAPSGQMSPSEDVGRLDHRAEEGVGRLQR